MHASLTRSLVLLVVTALFASACDRRAGETAAIQKPIPGIDSMTLSELNLWLERCAPYQSSPAAMQKNPYDPTDCDRVQRRRVAWLTRQTQAPAPYLPAVH